MRKQRFKLKLLMIQNHDRHVFLCFTLHFVPISIIFKQNHLTSRILTKFIISTSLTIKILSRSWWFRSNRHKAWKRSSRTRVFRSRTRARLLLTIYCPLIEVLTKTIYLWYMNKWKRRRKVSKGPIKTWSMARLGTADEVECAWNLSGHVSCPSAHVNAKKGWLEIWIQ